MALAGFADLYDAADARATPVAVAAAGGDDPTVLEALRDARDRGWVAPIVVGPEAAIRRVAEEHSLDLDGFMIVAVEGEDVPERAVAEVRQGRARMLMKGRVSTPALL